MRQAGHGFAADRGVGGDHAVHPMAQQCVANVGDLVIVQVRRDLQHHRHIALVLVGQALLRPAQRAEQAIQFARALQLAQVLGVRRRDIDRHIAGVRVDTLQTVQVVVDGALDRRVGVLADVQAQHAARLAPLRRLHIADERIDAAVVEAHAIDQRTRRRQPEHARPRIARLRARRHGAHFDEAEAERAQRIDVGAVLVQARRQPDRVRERDAHHRAGLRRHARADAARQPQRMRALELVQREVVRVFGVHRKQQRAGKRIQGVEHDREDVGRQKAAL